MIARKRAAIDPAATDFIEPGKTAIKWKHWRLIMEGCLGPLAADNWK